MSNVRVVELGRAVFDVLARTDRMRRGRIPVGWSSWMSMGAAPALPPSWPSSFGIPAWMIGTYGSNRAGQIKLQSLVENHVDVSRMVQRPGPETQAVIAFGGRRHGRAHLYRRPGF